MILNFGMTNATPNLCVELLGECKFVHNYSVLLFFPNVKSTVASGDIHGVIADSGTIELT